MPRDPREIDEAWWTEAGAHALPLGAPFRPGLDPIPTHQTVWAVIKDRWGRPAHGEPRDALRAVQAAVPAIGPDEALGYVLYAGLTYNTIFAARGVPISVFDLHDRDLHVVGSGAVVLVAALGSLVAREGRLRVGELRVLYPGVSDLLSPRAGEDPMHAEFKIQGYETPDGSFAQFVRGQAPQWLAHSERLTLAEGSSYMLDLETVYKALYDVARVQPGERVFVEGAAGGTGIYAVAAAALRGARGVGLVSTEDKGRLVRAAGGSGHVNRKAPGIEGIFTPVPLAAGERAAWRAAGKELEARVGAIIDGAPVDVVVSSVGRDLFARMVDLLGPGGRLVFYGATSGYTLTFLGKPGAAPAAEMFRRADLRPGEGVLVYWGDASGHAVDPVAGEAVAAALGAGARVVVAARRDEQAARVKAAHAVLGVVSLEALEREAGLRWPDAMPDYDRDREGFRVYQDTTLKPFGQAVGRLLATGDNPRGNPDVVFERPGADTLGVSTFLARPFTGRVVYAEAGAERRFSFYAPNVWMHEKRVLFPTFSILGSHLSNAHQADEVVRLLDAGALRVHAPLVREWSALPECHQEMHENRHTGTMTVRVGAGPALDRARTRAGGLRGLGLALPRRQDGARAAGSGAARCRRARRARHRGLAARQRHRAGGPRGPRAGGGGPRGRAAGARRRAGGLGHDVRGGRRHPGAPSVRERRRGRGVHHPRAAPPRAHRPPARAPDRGGGRVCAGRRKRAADGLRVASGSGAGGMGTAGDQPPRAAGLRRDAVAPAARDAARARARPPRGRSAGLGAGDAARRPAARAGGGPRPRARGRGGARGCAVPRAWNRAAHRAG